MGLLDEAIRDHLELKRRAGADASEIAHAERAALAPVFPDEPSAAVAEADVAQPDAAASAGPAHDDDTDRNAPVVPASEETVEIDMEAVLAAEDDTVASTGAARASGAPGGAADDDGFEWEDAEPLAHDADAGGPPEQIPGQERMSLE